MNYSRAFSYVFEDKDWLSKLLIAGLISLIPIIGQFYIVGWMIEIIRRVKAGRTDVLPTTHFSYFLTLGLKSFVVTLIYMIPVIVLTLIVQAFGSGAENSDGGFGTVFFTGMGCVGGLLTFIVQIAVSLLCTYGYIKLAQTDQIKECLDFKDAFYTIKDNITLFIIVELLAIVAHLIQGAGVILCFIGLIFTTPYSIAIVGHLVGQLWDNLKISRRSGRPYRGSVKEKPEDIIEEAPFTKIQDIEDDIVTVEPVQEAVILDEIPDIAEEAAAEVKENVEEAAEAAADTFAEVKENVEEAAEEAADTAAEVKENVEEAAADAFAEVKENVEEAAEEAADTAAEVKENVEEAVADTFAEVKENVEEAAEEAADTVTEVKENVEEAAEVAVEAAADKAAEVKDAVEEAAADAAAEVKETIEEAADAAADAAAEIGDAAEDLPSFE